MQFPIPVRILVKQIETTIYSRARRFFLHGNRAERVSAASQSS